MPNPEQPIAVKLYLGHERRRFVRLDDDARYLDHALQTCSAGGRLSLGEFLVRLKDKFDVPVLQSLPKEKRKLPPMWFDDDVTKQPLPNPWGTEREHQLRLAIQTLDANDPGKAKAEKELAAIRSEQIALSKSNPDLADHLKNMAYRPWQYQIELRQKECERLDANAREADYFATARKHANDGNNDWVREWVGNDVERAKIANREAAPLSLESILSPVRAKQKRDLLHKIAKEDRELYAVIVKAQDRERAQAELRAAAAEEAKRERVLAARDLQHDLLDAKHGVVRTGDGRVITNAVGAK